MLSCTIGFSNILVFMAGETYFGHFAARIVVVSISSAIPFAILPITLAEAGATIKNICTLCQCHMLDIELEIPVKRIDQTLVACERLKRDRINKIGCIFRHDHMHIRMLLDERTCQISNFIGSDTSWSHRVPHIFLLTLSLTPLQKNHIFCYFITLFSLKQFNFLSSVPVWNL